MGLFSWLRRGRGDTEPEGTSSATSPSSATPKPDDEWELVPAFVPVPEDERAIPSVIATAIAAGDRPDSEFTVTSVETVNPEARLVTVIATAIAAGDRPESEFVVRRVYRRKSA